jgi:glutaconyl-CoA/methylmalonyl-CoA decarboxylase subunit gamma
MNNRHLKLIVNGTRYEVEVGDLGKSPTTVLVNGTPYEVEIEVKGDHEIGKSPSIENPSTSQTEIKKPVQPIAEKPAINPSSSGTEKEVRSPMPGTILDIAVKPGESVNRGDQLCSLEAMKMKSAIRSPIAGVIASVEVSEGQKVVFGDVLIRYV